MVGAKYLKWKLGKTQKNTIEKCSPWQEDLSSNINKYLLFDDTSDDKFDGIGKSNRKNCRKWLYVK